MFTPHRIRQQGAVLIYVTLTLTIALLVLPALLVFIGGAGRTAQIREDRMLQVYAADAGIEKALHGIANGTIVWGGGGANDTLAGFNDNDVDVITEDATRPDTYRILSTATDLLGNVSTAIETYVMHQDMSTILDNAITSFDDIWIANGATINGGILLNGQEKPSANQWEPLHDNGQVFRGLEVWPNEQYLKDWYWSNPDNEDNLVDACGSIPICTFTETAIDVALPGNDELGPGYWTGNLNIGSSVDDSNLTLMGTMWVVGDLNLGAQSAGSHNYTLDLNGQAIFVESNSNQAIKIDQMVDIRGPGAIIAVGDIDANPASSVGMGEFVFMLSIDGSVMLNPGGTYYGSVAAAEEVKVKNGSPPVEVTWVPYEDDEGGFLFNFPPADGQSATAILSYIILDE